MTNGANTPKNLTMEIKIRIGEQKDKKTGKTYIYSTVDTWNRSSRKFIGKRKLLGRLDPNTNEVICTHKWKKGDVICRQRGNNVDVICEQNWDKGDVFGRIDPRKMDFQLTQAIEQGLSHEQCLALYLILDSNFIYVSDYVSEELEDYPKFDSMFISGSAGSGKTEILVRALVAMKKRRRILVMAPTGLAADNINQAYSEYLSKLREKGLRIPSGWNKRVAYTIHDRLKLETLEWFDPDVEGAGFFRNINKEEKNRILNFLREKRPDHSPTEEEISDEARNRLVNILINHDVIIIDEASMLSPNLLDIILKLKDLADKKRHHGFGDIRTILFGDLYQLPPVINTNDEFVRKNYEQHYHGGTLFFCCDRISKYRDGHPRTVFFELKENKRIRQDRNLSKRKQESNENFKKYLKIIKEAPNTLLNVKSGQSENKVEELKPLQEALVFFNRRYKHLSRFLELKSIRKLEEERHIFPKIICGTNQKRIKKNNALVEKYRGQKKEYVFELEDIAGIDGSGNPPRSFKYYEGLPVIFTIRYKCNIQRTGGVQKKPDTYVCPKGKTGTVSSISEDTNGKPVSLFVKVNINGAEKIVGPISPCEEKKKVHGGKPVKVKTMPVEASFALTYHKAQGQSLDAVYLLTSPKKNLIEGNSLYVGLSRAKDASCLGISRKFPLPLYDKKEKINWKNFNELCYKYFKVGNLETTDATTSFFFLNEIKKFRPSVYNNWIYYDEDFFDREKEDYSSITELTEYNEYYANDDTYQKAVEEYYEEYYKERSEQLDAYIEYIQSPDFIDEYDEYKEHDDYEEEYYNEGYDPEDDENYYVPEEDEGYYNEGYELDEDE